MNLEIKIFIFWIAIVAILYAICRLRFILTERTLNWKTFKDDYCSFGASAYALLYVGCFIWSIYGICKVAVWWFNIETV